MTAERFLLPRNSLLWLIAAQGAALLPLYWSLPFWLPLIWTGVLVWRLQEFRGRWPMPGRMLKVALTGGCVAGLLFSFRTMLGLEPMVSLLICAVLLKQLEMQRRRDALLLVFLNFFLIGVQFLFAQELLISLYAAGCVLLAVTALLSIQQRAGSDRAARSLRLAGRMMLHALPLTVLMFVVMPRIGSLWSVPNPTQIARTGVSDHLSPGDVSKLARSGGVAFRASFQGDPPAPEQLYWRGLVLSRFDGQSWSQNRKPDVRLQPAVYWGFEREPGWLQNREALGEPYQYSVILEPTQQRWLFSLDMVIPGGEAQTGIGLAWDGRLINADEVSSRLQYQVTSNLDYRLEPELASWRRDNELQLPGQGNPRARETAQRWRQESDSDEAYIDRLLALYRSDFVYTLEPPLLGKDSVDEFLWQSRQGFCEHFASSFVFMARAAGIPARVVVGYLGGEFNAQGGYWLVHQYDAHAWSEVWLPERGWVRVDPTAAVAPERVRRSLGDTQASAVEEVISLGRYRHIPLLDQMRMQWDALNYHWHRAVMGFDQDTQYRLLNQWLNGVSPLKLVLLVLFGGSLLLALISLHLWWQSRPPPLSGAQRYHQRFERLLLRRGWRRQPGETIAVFAGRVAGREQSPRAASALQSFVTLYNEQVYAGDLVSPARWEAALKRIRQALQQQAGANVLRPRSRH